MTNFVVRLGNVLIDCFYHAVLVGVILFNHGTEAFNSIRFSPSFSLLFLIYAYPHLFRGRFDKGLTMRLHVRVCACACIVAAGDRIAQLILERCAVAQVIEVLDLDDTCLDFHLSLSLSLSLSLPLSFSFPWITQ